MRGSSSVLPDGPGSHLIRFRSGRWFAGRWDLALAAVYLAAHLPFLPPTLEDVDSVNFALGLRDFDPGLHQPHPPGYPLYIALGHVSLFVVSSLWPSLAPVQAEAVALAVWSAIGGALAIVAAANLFGLLNGGSTAGRAAALWGAGVLAASPLFWIGGARPLSDAIGLAAALTAQALTVRGLVDRRWLAGAALAAGLAGGLRVQTLALTVPLLLVAVTAQRHAGGRWIITRPFASFVVGTLLWLVPLLVASGGLDAYLAALGGQANEDFSWVNMLWAEPTPRRLAFVLYDTFVLPWSWLPLAIAALLAVLAGFAMTWARDRRALLVVVIAFAPYGLFHLLFQDTFQLRYALPILPPLAWLIGRTSAAARPLQPLIGGALVAASLFVAVPTAVTYGREAHPAFRLVTDAAARARTESPGAVFAHFEIWRSLQADNGGLPVVTPRRQYEWLGMVDYWRRGGTAPVWFFADPRRTDLDLIDPRARADVTPYRWSVAAGPGLAATRPVAVDWYRLPVPDWFAGEGWALTPETGGLAQATSAGPGHRPIDAWARRRPGAMHLMIGGRHLGSLGEPVAEFELAIDDVVRDRWTVSPEQPNFLRFLDLPEGVAGADAFAHVTVSARSAGSESAPANAAVRQFDIQPATETIFGFGEGWHEEEFELATGRRWRWTSDRSILRIKGPGQPVQITLRGESPLRYFDMPPTVRVTVAGRVIGELQPRDDFEWSVTVPAEDLNRAQGAIAIEVDRVYRPSEVEGTSDDRRLGVRLWACEVHPALP